MANKKVYSIQINGLEESVKSVDNLLNQLKELTKTLENLKREKIEIPVTIKGDLKTINSQIQSVKKKVSDVGDLGGSSDASVDATYNKLLQDRERALAAVNKTLGDTNKNMAEFKQQTKDLVAEEVKARNEAQGYANTLNGLKQELKDLNSTKGNLDINSDEYKQTSQRIYEVTTKLKELEAAQGSFGRNVGNYTNSIINANNALQNGSQSVSNYASKIADLENKLNQARQSLSTFKVGSQDWIRAQADIVNYEQELNKLQNELNETENSQKKIKVVIGDSVREFNNMRQASRQLQQDLQRLSLAGKEDTKEFQDLVKAIKEFNKESYYTKDRMTELTKFETPLDKMAQTFKGFGSIAQMGMGIKGLFGGGSDSDSIKQIQQLQSLTAIMTSFDLLTKEMSKGTTFGEQLKKMLAPLNALTTALGLSVAKMQDVSGVFNSSGAIFGKTSATLQLLAETEMQVIAVNEDMRNEYLRLLGVAQQLGATFTQQYPTLIEMEQVLGQLAQQGKITATQFAQLKTEIMTLGNTAATARNNVQTLANTGFSPLQKAIALVVGSFKSCGTAIKNFINQIRGVNTATQNTATSSIQMSRGLSLASKGLSAATTGVKIFSTALKAIPLMFVIQLLMELVSWLMDGVKWLFNFATGNDKLVSSMNRVEGAIEATNKSIERYNKYVQKLVDNHLIDTVQASALMMEKLELSIQKAGLALQEFNSELNDSKPKALEDNLSYLNTWFQDGIDNVEEFKKRFNELAHAVETGSGRMASNNWFQNMWFTKSDAKTDFGEAQKRVIQDLQNEINKLDFSKKGAELQKDLDKFFQKVDSEMYQTSLKNIENLFPEQEWTKVLTQRLEQVRNMYEQMVTYAEEAGDAQIEIQRQIRDNYAEAIGDEREREKKQLENRRKDEIEAANGNVELIKSINAKYDRLEQDRVNKVLGNTKTLKSAADIEKEIRDNLTEAIINDYERQRIAILNAQDDEIKAANGNAQLIIAIKRKTNKKLLDLEKTHSDDLYEVQKRTRDNLLSIEEESLEKRIKAIENQRADELREASKNQNATEELILSINKKYDHLVEKEKEAHYKRLNELAEEYARKQAEIAAEASKMALEGNRNKLDNSHNAAINSSEGNFDFDAQYGKQIEAEKRFAQERLDIELKYLEDKRKLDEQEVNNDFSNNVESERQSYEDRLKSLKDMHKNGELSVDEYNQYVEKATEQHNQILENLETEKKNKLTNLDAQYLNERKLQTSEALRDEVDLYELYVDQVNDALKNFGEKKNLFGVTSFKQGKKQLDEAKKAIEDGLNDIQKEYENLDKRLKAGDITYADYKVAKQQLKETEKTLKEEGENINKMMTDLIKEVASEWKSLVDSWVSQIGSLLQTLNDTQLQLIENEMAMVDHQLEIAEDAYDRAEEAAQKHKDKMDSIEDELSEARGSRRQFLIDTLAAQEEAYQKDLDAQAKAAEEKERLEQKQKALEKKRKEQEKKAQVQQAIMNTYTAVSNALAVQPWFVGLALSAVALGLGMKNVAAIKATPIYEDGGVIQGKRHSQGGVKVLGGQAEVEGGEFITNRVSTAKNLPLLNYINDKKREVTAEELINFFNNSIPTAKTPKMAHRFADGGQLPTLNTDEISKTIEVRDEMADNRQYIVQVVDIANAQDKLNKVRVISGLENK